MKKILFILLCLLFIPLAFGGGSSPLFETYIGSTKNEIIEDLKDKPEKFIVSDRIQIRIDSLNRCIVNDNYYTHFFDFEDGSRLTVSFSQSTNLCTNYMFDFIGYDYTNQIQLFNESFEKIDSTTWYDSDTKSVIKLFSKGYKNGFSMYVYKKTHVDPKSVIFKQHKN
jgi:hypothetical protein